MPAFHAFKCDFLKENCKTEAQHTVFLLLASLEGLSAHAYEACSAVWVLTANVYMKFHPIRSFENHAAMVCHQKGGVCSATIDLQKRLLPRKCSIHSIIHP